MIIYFSGTGNSLYAARMLAKSTGEALVSSADLIRIKKSDPDKLFHYSLKSGERFGIVFPVHSWGPPRAFLEVIERIRFSFDEIPFCYSIATCGKNAGNSMKLVQKHLPQGLQLNSSYTLVMPNNFIILGDIYSKEKQDKILKEAEVEISKISSEVVERKSGIFRVEKGTFPFILTGVFNKAFNSAPDKAGKFYSTDACNGCGICEKVCPCNNIVVDEKPSWGDYCSQCLACIHHCPERAIEYGKSTKTKGRYTNPYVN